MSPKFIYEDDPLKHHIRVNGWLPICKIRLERIREIDRQADVVPFRRLRYFTFCAVGAVDVLMLDVAKVIRQSNSGRFDTVVFFDKTPEDVVETKKRIPGAIGIPGDFLPTVLLNDPDEELIVEAADEELVNATALLDSESDEADTKETRERQTRLYQRQLFIREFPFDVINLDLEEFLFRQRDEVPGRLIRAFRRILEWQKRERRYPGRNNSEGISEFSLMFTTQIGPPNLNDEYLAMLANAVNDNLEQRPDLAEIFLRRNGHDDVIRLREESFEDFFKVAMPKVLASMFMETDWFINDEQGIRIFEFEREAQDGNYKMLHMVMNIKRHIPRLENRRPGEVSQEAASNYRNVVTRIFENDAEEVTLDNIDQQGLREDLERIFARRRLYYPDDQ